MDRWANDLCVLCLGNYGYNYKTKLNLEWAIRKKINLVDK